MSGRGWLWWISAPVITAGLLVWVFRDVPLGGVVSEAGRAVPHLLLASVGVHLLTLLMRSARWRLMLASSGTVPSWGAVFRALVLGTFANNVLPARSGDVVRAVTLRSSGGPPVVELFSSIAAERVIDLLTVIMILCAGLALSAHLGTGSPSWAVLGRAAYVAGILAVGAAVLLGVFAWKVERIEALWGDLATRIPRLPSWAVGAAADSARGVAFLRHPVALAAVVGWTVVIWSSHVLAVWLALEAFSLEVPLGAPLVLQGSIAMAISLPSAPGFFGPFEAAGRAALGLFGVQGVVAAAFALTFHVVVAFLPTVLLGLIVLFLRGSRLSGLAALKAPGGMEKGSSME